MSAIVPGEPDDSEMIRRILSDDPEEQMPPPETKKKLTDAQKELLDALDHRGGRVSAALVVHRAGAAAPCRRSSNSVVGPQSDRQLRPGAAGSGRPRRRRRRPIAARWPAG